MLGGPAESLVGKRSLTNEAGGVARTTRRVLGFNRLAGDTPTGLNDFKHAVAVAIGKVEKLGFGGAAFLQ